MRRGTVKLSTETQNMLIAGGAGLVGGTFGALIIAGMAKSSTSKSIHHMQSTLSATVNDIKGYVNKKFEEQEKKAQDPTKIKATMEALIEEHGEEIMDNLNMIIDSRIETAMVKKAPAKKKAAAKKTK